MKKTWIVVAESSRATSPKEPLHEIATMVHMDAKLHMLDLRTEKPGLTFDCFGYGRHAKTAEVDPKKHEADLFAKQLAGRNEFKALILIADPECLGRLRQHPPEGGGQGER